VILKNVKHHLKLWWSELKLISRHDVLIERGVTVKYADNIVFGSRCTLQSGTYLYGSRSGKAVTVGSHVVFAACSMVLGEGGVEIGDFTHLGPHVVVTSQYGDSRTPSMTERPTVKTDPVRIGKGCWIGSGTVVMPGTSLGDRCIVAPLSVVYGHWADGVTLAGNPARRVKSSFGSTRPESRGASSSLREDRRQEG
jgi:acetyltransferase-like isoleucine patch superfamily enzyme